MKYYLSFKNNQYYLIKEQNKRRKSTNNPELINKKIIELLDSSICCIISGKKIIVKCSDDKLVIDDLNNLLDLEKTLQNSVNNLLFEQIKNQIRLLPKQRVNNINTKKIAAILLAGTIFSSVFSTNISKAYANNENSKSTTSFTQMHKKYSELKTLLMDENNFSKDDNFIVIEDEIIEEIEDEIIEEIEEFYFSEDFTIEKRLEQSNSLFNQTLENNHTIPIATQMSPYCLNRIMKFLNSEAGQVVYMYAKQFGVDPYMMVAVAMKESSLLHDSTCPDGKYYNKYAIGLFQHEEPNGQLVTAYNFETNQNETEILTVESAINLEKNIKIGAMKLQNSLNHYKGNVYLALQGYHWGNGVTDLAICEYANRIGTTYTSVVEDLSDTGWLVDFKQIRNNPNEYGLNIDKTKYTENEERSALVITINSLINWDVTKKGRYGNDKYIEETLSFYLGQISQNTLKFNKEEEELSEVTMDLLTGQKSIEQFTTTQHHK